jgi:hypothetical protein
MSTTIFQHISANAFWNNIHPNTIFKTLMVTGFLTVLLACNLLQSPEMKFEIDHHLLGMHEKIPALKVSYHVPAGFSKLADTAFSKHNKNILSRKEKDISISAVYQDTTTGALMILSRVSEDQWEQYHEFVDNTPASPLALEWNHVNATTFTYHQFDVQQWLLQDLEWVNFRLLFNKNSSFFQVDYLIPTLKYDKEIARIIESSIGSFQSN